MTVLDASALLAFVQGEDGADVGIGFGAVPREGFGQLHDQAAEGAALFRAADEGAHGFEILPQEAGLTGFE